MKHHVYSSKHYIAEPASDGNVKLTYDDGYVSQVPVNVFERDFRQNGELSFGDALVALEQRHRVQRSGWNGKGMYLAMVPANEYAIHNRKTNEFHGLLPWVGMKTADNKFVPWLASQTDVLAKDWSVLDQD